MPTLSRRSFLHAAGAVALVSRFASAAPAKRPMNVLFIPVDDLRPQLRCFGHERMISPNMDALAASGAMFTSAYCQQAVCAPSRASLLSGCRPDTTKIYDLETPLRSVMPDVVTLPQLFKQSGYHTVSMGKIYHHRTDDRIAWSEDPWSAPSGFPGAALKENVELIQRLRKEAKAAGRDATKVRGVPTECADVDDDAYHDGQLATAAIAKIRQLKDRPFFIAAGFLKPHLPFMAPKRYWDLYKPQDIQLADNPFAPKGAPPLALTNWGELRAYYGIPAKGPLPDELARRLIHGYYAAVSYVDAQIGRLLKALDELGLRDNTVVCLWGDHGWSLGEHGLWCKHTNFEDSVHAPMFIRAPGQPAGVRCNALTEFVDIYPTLADLCGLKKPGHLEGTSLVPLLSKPDQPWKSAAFSQYPRGKVMGYSMRTRRYRFTRWQDPKGNSVATELYDHQVDPHENTNIAAEPASAELVGQLAGQLKRGWKGALPGQ